MRPLLAVFAGLHVDAFTFAFAFFLTVMSGHVFLLTLPSASSCLAARASPAPRSGAETLAPLCVLAARLYFAGHGRLQLRAGGSVVFCTTLGRKSTASLNRLLLAAPD